MIGYDRVQAQESEDIPTLALSKISQAMNTGSMEMIGDACVFGNSFALNLLKNNGEVVQDLKRTRRRIEVYPPI